MQKIEIIHEPTSDEEFVVIFKPKGLPTAPLSEDDKNNAFSQVADYFPEVLSVNGKKIIEHGLLHRIDTLTSGLVIIATSQKSYDKLIEIQKNNLLIKSYKAKCDYIPDISHIVSGYSENLQNFQINEPVEIQSFFRAYGKGRKEVRPVSENDTSMAIKKIEKKVLYTTKITLLSTENNQFNFKCQITNGFRHQVRSHLAWTGFPLYGDPLYNPTNSNPENFTFIANEINIDGLIFKI